MQRSLIFSVVPFFLTHQHGKALGRVWSTTLCPPRHPPRRASFCRNNGTTQLLSLPIPICPSNEVGTPVRWCCAELAPPLSSRGKKPGPNSWYRDRNRRGKWSFYSWGPCRDCCCANASYRRGQNCGCSQLLGAPIGGIQCGRKQSWLISGA